MTEPSKPGDPPVQDSEKTSKDPELVAFGRRLCELREAAGMTQEALAHAAGLHWTYVGQVERGERNLSYKNVLKLARGLGLEPAELVRGQGLPKRSS
jgi:transcriptional regulator with XRE-family HTH domain